ncbi:MAG: DNA-processing protein DprA [Pseudomonadota bacterium]
MSETGLLPNKTLTNERAWWLALLRAPRIGPVTFFRLLSHFKTPERVFAAGRGELSEFDLKGKTLDYLQSPDWSAVEQDLAWLKTPGHHILTAQDTLYPKRLLAIHDPPPVLFVQGDPALLIEPQLALVGSRNPSKGGESTAFEFSRYLSKAGLVITSGLAFGIDAASHHGALAESGKTIAVAATGLNTVYPSRHTDLALSIIAEGAIVSEFPPDTPVLTVNFPRRNRIISGLSLGVLVIEATLRSGSLITAKQAAEQGREVFAIPGSIHNPLVKGCHALIKEGAKLVESGEDVIEELASYAARINDPVANTDLGADASAESNGLDEDYSRLLDHMTVGEPVAIDVLVERCELPADAVSSMLLVLELQGLVSAEAGGQYIKLKL